MIGWLAVGAAALIALAVLGFCAYEISWRARRLHRDVATIVDLVPAVDAVQRQLVLLQHRAPAHSSGPANSTGPAQPAGRAQSAGQG